MLKEGVEQAYSGNAPRSPQTARKGVNHFRQIRKPVSDIEKLTAREREVLALLAEGYLYKEIAGSLCISINTVRNHQRTIYDKLRVHSRTQAAVKYLRRGLFLNEISNPGA